VRGQALQLSVGSCTLYKATFDGIKVGNLKV
jgi:hypothetical protein